MRDSAWKVTWAPAAETPLVLMDYGDLMDDEIARDVIQLVDIGRFDQAATGLPYGRGNKKRRLELTRTVEFDTAAESWQAMIDAAASDPWKVKELLQITPLSGGSQFVRAAILSISRETVTLPYPGYREKLSLRVDGGLVPSGPLLTIIGGWFNPPIVGGGTTSGGITIIVDDDTPDLTEGDAIYISGVSGVSSGYYLVTGVNGNQVTVGAPTNNAPRHEGEQVEGISENGYVDMEYGPCTLYVDGMGDGAAYTYFVNGVGPATITPDAFGRAVINIGTLVSRITYDDWEHLSLDPLPIDGQNHSPGDGPPDFLVEETGPSGWTVELTRNGALRDTQEITPSWKTSKTWNVFGGASHILVAPSGATFDLHANGSTSRRDTGVSQPITGGSAQKAT